MMLIILPYKEPLVINLKSPSCEFNIFLGYDVTIAYPKHSAETIGFAISGDNVCLNPGSEFKQGGD